ncbi:MAG TPA: diguanylate cyclase [Acidimicrobiales bacterium]|nr:diguanylate cyclase [Acidimicrobiales bacterium]
MPNNSGVEDNRLPTATATAPASDLFDQLPDALVVIDGTGTVTRGNRAAERIMGRSAGGLVGINGLDLVHPDDFHLAALSLSSVEGKEVGTPIELRIATDHGWRLIELVGAPLDDGHIVLSMRDLTERRRWEVAGGDVARFRTLVQHATSLTMLLDADGVVTSASGALSRQLGLDPELVCDHPLVQIVHPDDRILVRAAIVAATGSDPGAAPTPVEARLSGHEGHVPFELTIVSLLDDPTVSGLVVSGHDITRLRAAQETLAELAHFDSLTGLPNRRAFDAALEDQWRLTARDGVDSYVIVVDLDEFKELNDRHGHATGDEALRQVAHALQRCVRSTDAVARLGGDEFGIILIRCGGEAAAIGFAAELDDRISEACNNLPAPHVGLSLGYASLRAADSAPAALHHADLAMYAKKRSR